MWSGAFMKSHENYHSFHRRQAQVEKNFDHERAKIVEMSVKYTQKRMKQALEMLTTLARIIELQKELKKSTSSPKENFVKSKFMEQIIKDAQLGLPLYRLASF